MLEDLGTSAGMGDVWDGGEGFGCEVAVGEAVGGGVVRGPDLPMQEGQPPSLFQQ